MQETYSTLPRDCQCAGWGLKPPLNAWEYKVPTIGLPLQLLTLLIFSKSNYILFGAVVFFFCFGPTFPGLHYGLF